MTYDCRYCLVTKGNLCSKRLCLGSQIHNGSGANCRITICQSLYCLIMNPSVTDSLSHGVTIHLNTWMRQHRQCRNLLSMDDINHPLSHILLHQLL